MPPTKPSIEPVIKRISIDRMIVDPRYQRPLSEHRVGRMVKMFNPRQLGTLEVSRRADGTHAIVDGQHRLAALRAVGRKVAACVIHSGLDAAAEAELFVRHQQDRRAPSPVERFRAQVFYGSKMHVHISDIATQSGFSIVNAPGAGNLRCVSRLESVYRQYGSVPLGQALAFIREVWYGEDGSADSPIVGGMTKFLSDYGDRFDAVAKSRLEATAPRVLIRKAMARTTTGGNQMGNLVAAEIRSVTGIRGKARPANGS